MKIKQIILGLFITGLMFASSPKVKPGIEVLMSKNFDILKGKRVGLLTNPTGVTSDLRSTLDIFASSKEFKLTALFAPEHGIRGDFYAGDHIENCKDPQTGLQVFSLHGKTRKPTAEMLKDIDVLVYDLQDIGCRSYTFVSALGLCMEACAENNKELVVLDRPNPLGGNRIEGNLTEKKYISYISQYEIPYVYGMTPGELARFYNEEGLLKNKAKCKLTVVPMEGWTRNMSFEDTKLPWVPTSPNVPGKNSASYYVATGVMGELGVYSEGVGYTLPFELLGAEWVNSEDVANKMNALNLQGVKFRPIYFKGYFAGIKDKKLGGVQIYITDFSKVELLPIQYYFMQVAKELYPDKNPFEMVKDDSRTSMFDKANGTNQIRELFSKNFKVSDIKDYLNKDVESFREKSSKYYLYK